jgi:chaperonin GroES
MVTKTKQASAVCSIFPMEDRVLIRRTVAPSVSQGGIILPVKPSDKPREGIVEAVGVGKLLDDGTRAAMTVKVGDKVLFSSYGGSEVEYAGEPWLIIQEQDILAIVR